MLGRLRVMGSVVPSLLSGQVFPSQGEAGGCMCDFLIMQYPDMIEMPTLVLYGKFSTPKIARPSIFSPLQAS